MERPIGFLDNAFGRTAADKNEQTVVRIADALRLQTAEHGHNLHVHHLHHLLDALPAAVYTTDTEGSITYYNDAAAELWGHRPPLGASEWCGSWKLFWPDGTPMAHDECPMAVALKRKQAVRGVEAIAERPDGARVPFLACPTPLFDGAGRLTGAVNMLIDITERKRAEDEQALLIRELHHRVKNTLATVQAIMNSTARTADNIEDFKDALVGRIGSLAKTHLLLAEEPHAVTFADLLHKELDAFDDGTEGRAVVSGPRVRIDDAPRGVARHGLTRARHQRRQTRRALGSWRQGGSDLAPHH